MTSPTDARAPADGAASDWQARAAVVFVVGAFCSLIYVVSGGASIRAPGATKTSSIVIAGSETVRPLLAACVESYLSQNISVDIDVRGGGSGDGMAALLAGIVDTAMISRDVTAGERDFAKNKGFDIAVHGIARDAVAVIVHPANPVKELSFDQLRAIYTGEMKDWRDVGGNAGTVQAFERAAGSGTRALFNERILAENGPPSIARAQPTNEAIVSEVATSPVAVGYSGLGAVSKASNEVKIVAVSRAPNTPAVPADTATIAAGSYPLARTLALVTAGPPSSLAADVIAHCRGPVGQALAHRAGYAAVLKLLHNDDFGCRYFSPTGCGCLGSSRIGYDQACTASLFCVAPFLDACQAGGNLGCHFYAAQWPCDLAGKGGGSGAGG